MKLAVFIGKGFLFLASMAFLATVSLFVVGAWLTTWPIMRVSPRNRKMKASMEVALALVTAARAFGLGNEEEDS